MKAGALKQRVEIQQRTSSTGGGFGPPVMAFSSEPVTKVWAQITPIRGNQYFAAGQMQTQISHRIAIRYRTGITSKNRIKYGPRTFDIESVINTDEANRQLELMCNECMTT